MDFHLSYGDAAVFLGAEPRFSVADAMENTHRLDEAFFESLVVQTKATGVHLLASAERAVGTVDMRRISTLLAVCRDALSLHVPRRAALGSRRPRLARRRRDDPHRRQPGAGDGAQRRPHRRDARGSGTARIA